MLNTLKRKKFWSRPIKAVTRPRPPTALSSELKSCIAVYREMLTTFEEEVNTSSEDSYTKVELEHLQKGIDILQARIIFIKKYKRISAIGKNAVTAVVRAADVVEEHLRREIDLCRSSQTGLGRKPNLQKMTPVKK